MTAHPDQVYGPQFDYRRGSPHLRDPRLFARVASSLERAVTEIARTHGRCRALEIGAGHGSFTTILRRAGAKVVATEMSAASAARMSQQFEDDANVLVIHDQNGDWLFENDISIDLCACISVLHHIPDYMRTIRRVTELTQPGGAFISWQDPTWYPRGSRTQRLASTASYLAWRITQGNY